MTILFVGCGDYRSANESNTLYLDAEKARQEGDYDLAVRRYQKCLQFSPGSYKAHLQLAIIYDEQSGDFPRAITHYQEYLVATDTSNTEVLRMLHRVERKYFEHLSSKYKTIDAVAEASFPVRKTTLIPASKSVIHTPSPKVQRRAPVPVETEQQVAPTPVRPRQQVIQSPAQPQRQVVSQPRQVERRVIPPPAPAPASKPEPQTYVVQDGDNLSRISNKVYGTKKYWKEIYQANRHILSSPERIRVGQQLILPPIN